MKDSRICHPETRPLPHKDYFELKAIEEKKKRYKKSSLPSSICLKARYQFIIKVINCIMFIYIHIYIPRIYIQKETATHSSILAWRIPGTGEPGRLSSMGSQRVGHD